MDRDFIRYHRPILHDANAPNREPTISMKRAPMLCVVNQLLPLSIIGWCCVKAYARKHAPIDFVDNASTLPRGYEKRYFVLVMHRKRLLVCVLLLIGVMCMRYSYLDNVVQNMEISSTQPAVEALSGSSVILRQEPIRRIGIVTVLNTTADRSKYRTAMETMECYALMHNYTYLVLNAADYKKECPHNDIMFRRHCIVAIVLESFEWILFVDADIGVVNEKGTLERFLEPDKDIIFYIRIFIHEVMAGSYLVKRSAFSKRFLRGWADYESLLPRSFHGSDNGAIHMWLIKQLPWLDGRQCEILWNASTGYLTLSYFTVCCREVLQAANFSNIRILEKGEAWVRDSWLTNSHWNPKVDFMFHVRKEADKRPYEENDIGQVSIMKKAYRLV